MKGREMHLDSTENRRVNMWLHVALFTAMAMFVTVSALAPISTEASASQSVEQSTMMLQPALVAEIEIPERQLDPRLQKALDACYLLESSGGKKLSGDLGQSVGPLHIQKRAVDDVNRILGRQEFKYSDRMSLKKSGMIFYVYLIHYGKAYTKETKKAPTTETYVRMWNGGPDGWKEKSTAHHWNKAKGYLAKAGG